MTVSWNAGLSAGRQSGDQLVPFGATEPVKFGTLEPVGLVDAPVASPSCSRRKPRECGIPVVVRRGRR